MKWDLGIATFSEYDPDGFIGVQADLYGEDKAGSPPFEGHSPFGFISRPLDPTLDAAGEPTGQSCSILYAWEGSRGHAWLLGDSRITPTLPQLPKGSGCLYGATSGNKASFYLVTGSTTGGASHIAYAPYSFDSSGNPGKAHSFQLLVDAAGNESVQLIHGNGMAITMTAGGANSVVIKNASGSVYVEINDSGLVFNGNAVLNGSLAAGNPAAQSGVPTQLTTIALLASLAAYQATVSAAIAALVPGTGIADPTGALVSAVTTASAELTAAMTDPTLFSLTVTASP